LVLEEGLATVHAYSAEQSGHANEYFAAEQRAKDARKGLVNGLNVNLNVALHAAAVGKVVGLLAERLAGVAGSAGSGQEAHDLANRRCMQRDVEIDVETIDKVGGFIGSLYLQQNGREVLFVDVKATDEPANLVNGLNVNLNVAALASLS
jgi:hypothetical protein